MTTLACPRLAVALLPLGLLLSAGCHRDNTPDTGIIIEVTSDLRVPGEINQVHLIAKNPQDVSVYDHTFDLGQGPNRFSLPLRAGLYPLHDTSTPIHIEAVGQLDGQPVVSRSATLSFVHGQKVVLVLPLWAVCRPVKCTVAFETCKDNGKCDPDTVDSSTLPPYVPNRPVPGTDGATVIPDAQTPADAMDAAAEETADTAADRPRDLAPDVAGGRDAFPATGGAGGTDGPSGTGGVVGTDGGPAAADVRTEVGDMPGADAPPDVPVGGGGGTDGPSGTGGVVGTDGGPAAADVRTEVGDMPSCTPPAAPTALVATGNNGSVALTWTAPAGAVSYRVLRSTTSGSGYVLLGTSGTASYTDTNVTNGTTYYYVVTASNGVCSSANSAQAPATPACTPPSKPTGLAATPGNGQIALAWTASTGGATLYQVLRGTKTGGPYTAIATPTSTGYTDTGLINGTTYYYVVTASNGSCSSANSAELAAIPMCTPPSVPTITAAPGDGQVVLSWTAATGGAVSYVLSRGTVSGGPYGTVVASPTGTTYTDKTVVNGTTYYYVVSSNNGACQSLPSAEAPAKPVAACNLLAPTGVTATAGSQQVTLSWTAAAGATSYNIGRSTTSGTGYTSAGTVTAPTVTFLDNDAALVNGTKYYYVVTASNTLCTSPGSTEVSATPV
jgi:fibronectin type 3 domain-containing protein